MKALNEEKKLDMLVDKDLKGSYSAGELEKMVELALQCTLANPSARPKMSEVLKVLEDVSGRSGLGEESHGGNSLSEERCTSLSRQHSDGQEEYSFVFENIELSGPR